MNTIGQIPTWEGEEYRDQSDKSEKKEDKKEKKHTLQKHTQKEGEKHH